MVIFKKGSVETNGTKVVQTDLNPISEFVLHLSNNTPILYGAFAIVIAILLGALASLIRKLLSDLRKRMVAKT